MRKWKTVCRTFALICMTGTAGLLMWVWSYGFHAATVCPKAQRLSPVFIPANSGFQDIKRLLAENGLIRDDIRFVILARLMGLASRLRAGEYSFAGNESPYRILVDLEAGKVVQHAVTIPEGANLYQIADILAADGLLSRDKFLQLANDYDFIRKIGLPAASLEGYLFPDTYNFTKGMQGRRIIRSMVDHGFEVLSGIPNRVKYLNGQSFSRHEIITLASIVEKETAVPGERQIIAGVFLNRLKRGMRLQADPTVRYGLAKFSGRLTSSDLHSDTPYNTYKIKGLPPGPICNPGRAAVRAVLKAFDVLSGSVAAGDPYLYFVSKNNGTHYFSRTLSEHNRAVAIYQKKGGSRQISP